MYNFFLILCIYFNYKDDDLGEVYAEHENEQKNIVGLDGQKSQIAKRGIINNFNLHLKRFKIYFLEKLLLLHYFDLIPVKFFFPNK